MIVLDGTIVDVALPSIRDDLGFSQTSLAWVANAYLLTFGGFLLLGGRLGDLFGQRRMFLIGIALFTAASVACGIVDDAGMLVGARAVQGLGGALVSAVALSLLMTLFTVPGERAKAMGIFGFVLSGGGAAGVLLGGVLTDLLSWHWIFLVNVPVGVVVYLLSLRCCPATPGRRPAAHRRGRRDDGHRALVLAVYAIVNGNEAGWGSAQTLGLLGAAGVLLAPSWYRVADVVAARAPRPLPHPRLGGQRGRRADGRRHVRLVLLLRPLPPADPGLHAARGGPGVPALDDHLGRRLAVSDGGDAVRDPAAAGVGLG